MVSTFSIPEEILKEYQIPAGAEIRPVGSGHIHFTYWVCRGGEDLIIQQINHHIFRDVEGLMQNLRKVTRFIWQHFGGTIPPPTIQLMPTINGADYIFDKLGNYWRAFRHISGTLTLDVPQNINQGNEAGKALGRFYRMLDGFPLPELNIVLPRFHELGYRLQQFREALNVASDQRLAKASELIQMVNSRAEELMWLDRMIAQGQLPVRVVHNDPKINNVLFDEHYQAICMIDLDTVMPGCLLHDYGDALRTTANPAPEDETDLSKVVPHLGLIEAYTRGFLGEVGKNLTEAEKKHLHKAPAFLTFVIGLRFLTDYLNHDKYYHVSHPEHNLQRASAQFALFKGFEQIEPEILKIVKTCVSLMH